MGELTGPRQSRTTHSSTTCGPWVVSEGFAVYCSQSATHTHTQQQQQQQQQRLNVHTSVHTNPIHNEGCMCMHLSR